MFKEANKRLKIIRATLNLKRKPIADLFEVKEYKISDIENGKSSMDEEMIKKLVNEYDINLNWLLFGKGEIFLNKTEINKKIINGDNAMINVNTANNGKIKNGHTINYNSTNNMSDNRVNELIDMYQHLPPREQEIAYHEMKIKYLKAEH